MNFLVKLSRFAPVRMLLHSRKRAFIFVGTVILVLLMISLVHSAAIRKPGDDTGKEKHSEFLQGLHELEQKKPLEIDNLVQEQDQPLEAGDDGIKVQDLDQPVEQVLPPHDLLEGNAGAEDNLDGEDIKVPGKEESEEEQNNGAGDLPDTKEDMEEEKGAFQDGNVPGKLDLDAHAVEIGDPKLKFARVKDALPLKMKDLKPPDHLDGIRMEQDGHLNRDFRKEIFLGNHEHYDDAPLDIKQKVLKDIFHNADIDDDGFLTLTELQKWIEERVKEHIDEALRENHKVFHTLDLDQDGFVAWKEFHVEFLRAKGFDDEEALNQSEDYDTIPLDPEDKDTIIRYRFRWAEADNNQDNKLTKEEFQNFRHPEQSQPMLDKLVEEILDNLDHFPKDGKITEQEFAALPPGEDEEDLDETDKTWQQERLNEFRNNIDLNHDHIVSRDELRNYVDPRNPYQSQMEAENLLQLADDSGDGKLSMQEVIDNLELFFGSKFVDTCKSFHDEF